MALNLPEHLDQEVRRSNATLAILTAGRTAGPDRARSAIVDQVYRAFPGLTPRDRTTIINSFVSAVAEQQSRLSPGQTRVVKRSAIPAIAQATPFRYSVTYSFLGTSGTRQTATTVIPADRQLAANELRTLATNRIMAIGGQPLTSGLSPEYDGLSPQALFESIQIDAVTVTESL
jgi:hypothetical protein